MTWIADGREHTRVIELKGWRGEVLGYLAHCLALLVPGIKVPVFSEPREPVTVGHYTPEAHLDLLITEARSLLARHQDELANIRSRALSMTTVALTELGLLAATASRFTTTGGWPLAAWIACFVVVVLGLAGMASIASSRADFYTIDIPTLLGKEGDLKTVYTNELIGCLPLGQVTLDARRTVFRDALQLMALGAIAYGIVWILMLNQ